MEQGSPEWLALRCGKITGSRFRAVLDLSKRNGQPNKPRRDLVQTLVAEIRTGCPEYTEPNEYMAHGTAMEPLAVKAYEFATDCTVEQCAFVQHPTLGYIGYSPDGFPAPNGLLEVKSPFLPARHTRTVDSQRVPDDYMPQCQGGMWVCEREWCDFVSYFPSISVEIVRVYRDEQFINRLAAECAAVWSLVQSALTEEVTQ